ncbi:hypothetical protein [Streptomonospora wellingtoniae]|uniref:ABC transporter permease n=1 Tax=Streptomonospora wellingtoniae TaxID=3075544 RepID=A0ABU2KUN3_9ACTN|nr:hypothetical protein [Streptomonospora sp. DSM 45055]MDT0302872.1 hypothetical protein [Streptomonospora sp. DSM 45055]
MVSFIRQQRASTARIWRYIRQRPGALPVLLGLWGFGLAVAITAIVVEVTA